MQLEDKYVAKSSQQDVDFRNAEKKRQITTEFMQKLAGQDDEMLRTKIEMSTSQYIADRNSSYIRLPVVSFKQPRESKDLKNTDHQKYKLLFDGRKSRHTFMSEDGKYIYHLGVIDYLQDFNFEKWGENKFKSLINDGNLISAVPPDQYLKRFFNFMM